MFTLKVKNYRGIEYAEIPMKGINLLTGLNNAGKTSIIQAAQTLYAGVDMPPNILKKEAKQLVRDGNKKAEVSLVNGTSTVSCKWPNPKVEATGPRPYASKIVCGCPAEKFELSNSQTKTLYLNKLLNAHPSNDKLVKELDENGIKVTKEWVDSVDAVGYDGALKSCREQKSQLKGGWQLVTGLSYKKENLDWQPERWKPTWEKAKLGDFQAARKELQTAYEEAIKRGAVSSHELKGLKMRADNYDAHVKTMDKFDEKIKEVEAKIKEMGIVYPVRDLSDKHDKYECPGCKLELSFVGGELVDATGFESEEEFQKRIAEEREKNDKYMKFQDELTSYQAQRAQAQLEAKDAHEAKEELAAKKDMPVAEEDEIADAAAKLDVACQEEKALEEWIKAQELEEKISQLETVEKILHPDGLRKSSLFSALKKFNNELRQLSDIAKWETVSINGDLQIYYGSRTFWAIAESEQYKCVVTLQAAILQRDNSEVILVDSADRLDKQGRNGLIRLLRHIDKPSLVGMTFSSKNDLPDSGGPLNVWWIEDGEVEEILPPLVVTDKEVVKR